MVQANIERVEEQPVEVLEPEVLGPDEIIEVQAKPVSTTRPDAKVRTTEIVAKGLDLLTSLGRLVLRFLQEPDASPGVSSPSRSPSSEPPVDRRATGRRGGRRRRHRGGV